MNVLLVSPPTDRLKGYSKGFKEGILPFGLGAIAAVLENHDIHCRVFNANLAPELEKFPIDSNIPRSIQVRNCIKNFHDPHFPAWVEIESLLRSEKPDVLGITSTSPEFPFAIQIARICRRVLPECAVAIGGTHATLDTQNVISRPEFDFVIRGEGEYTFLELVQALRDGGRLSSIRGLSYKNELGEVLHNEDRELIEDLDELPRPDYELLIHQDRFKPETYCTIIASRGCPYRCTFCASSTFWKNRLRTNSPKRVLDDIEYYVQKYGLEYLVFMDDLFTLNRRNLLEVCDGLVNRGLSKKIRWACYSRIDSLDEEILTALKQANCRKLSVGIEFGSDRILESVNKKITVEQMMENVSRAKRMGFLIHGFYMVGHPEETAADIHQTIKLMRTLRLDSNLVSVLMPLPGTPIYERLLREGRIPTGFKWDNLEEVKRYETKGFTNIEQEEFDKLVLEMMRNAALLNLQIRSILNRSRFFMKFLLKKPGLILREIKSKLVDSLRFALSKKPF